MSSLSQFEVSQLPLGVVACDAGAANLIAGWSDSLPKPLFVCAEGPAEKILKKAWPFAAFVSLEELLSRARTVLTGTGWSSHLEHNARYAAQRAQIPTIAVIDHWVNYRERFSRDGIEVLPNLLVVVDEHAELLAKRFFPDIPIECWPNVYLEREIAAIEELRVREPSIPAQNILMVMEPIRKAWPGDCQQGELVAAEFFLENLGRLGIDCERAQIKLRPHPSDYQGKYDALVAHWRETLDIVVNEEVSSLAENIAWADLVAGCESYALVIALNTGLTTISMLPPHAPLCRLPHPELSHLKELIIQP